MVKQLSDENDLKQKTGNANDSKADEVSDSLLDSHDICQFLTFSVDKELYGVDLLKIREIKGWTETTRLPNSPEFMKGVINLRGAVIPIFDLKGRFNIGETIPTEKNVVIIIAVGDRLMGILVDAVSDIIEVESGEIKQAPQMETRLDDKFVSGLISIENKMVVVLDVDSLFDTSSLNIEGNLVSDM